MPLAREKCCHVPIPFSIFDILPKLRDAEVIEYFNYQPSQKASPIRVKTLLLVIQSWKRWSKYTAGTDPE